MTEEKKKYKSERRARRLAIMEAVTDALFNPFRLLAPIHNVKRCIREISDINNEYEEAKQRLLIKSDQKDNNDSKESNVEKQ